MDAAKDNNNTPNLRPRIGRRPRPLSTSTPAPRKKTPARKRKISETEEEERTVKQRFGGGEEKGKEKMISRSPSPARKEDAARGDGGAAAAATVAAPAQPTAAPAQPAAAAAQPAAAPSQPATATAQPMAAPSQPATTPAQPEAALPKSPDGFDKLMDFFNKKLDEKFDDMKNQMDRRFNNVNDAVEKLNSEAIKTNNALSAATAQAVANKTEISNIKKKLCSMERDGSENLDRRVSEAITRHMNEVKEQASPSNVTRELDRVAKELDKIKAVQAVQAINKNSITVSQPRERLLASTEDEERSYWTARRKLRCFPIAGNNTDDLWRNTQNFFENVLAIQPGDLQDGSIVDIKRITTGRRKNAVKDEVIVTFDSIHSRDIAASYAPNLADHRAANGANSAGIRLEIPDHLRGVFRTLERHGHNLKDTHKAGLRRSIKYDDTDLTLVLDACLPNSSDWFRVTYDDAVEQHKQKTQRHRGTNGALPAIADLSDRTSNHMIVDGVEMASMQGSSKTGPGGTGGWAGHGGAGPSSAGRNEVNSAFSRRKDAGGAAEECL